ncbi:MAG TPA: CBS domain-containing protein [Terriglobales bacterium]|nr:CBS domain-containing protein [Terriglobales bacterium]
MQVKEIMITKPSYCEPYWTVEAVALLMDHVGTGILPVIEGVLDRKVIGVVTDRDLCVRVVAPGLYPAHTWVKECMTPNPVCCRLWDDVKTALSLMGDNQVRRLPVVDQEMRLQGMISISEFIRLEIVEMSAVYETLRKLSQPRADSGKHVASVLHVA